MQIALTFRNYLEEPELEAVLIMKVSVTTSFDLSVEQDTLTC